MEVSDLAARTETPSCENLRLELPPNQDPSMAPNLVLLAKLISSKPTSLNYVREVALKAWRPVYPMEVRRLDKNIFMFSFQHEVDTHKVFQGRPWSCRGGHLVLKKWSPDVTWQEVDFTFSAFWVQVHGLPTLWKTEDNLKRIGANIGRVLDVDLIGESGGAWKRFLHVQVELPVDKPLLPGFFLPRPNNTDSWIGLKYEKLANICYKCGIISHEEESCSGNLFQFSNHNGTRLKAAGPWLRPGNDDTPLDTTAYSKQNTTPPPSTQTEAAATTSPETPLTPTSIATDSNPITVLHPGTGPQTMCEVVPQHLHNTWQSTRCTGAPETTSNYTKRNFFKSAELDPSQGTSDPPKLP